MSARVPTVLTVVNYALPAGDYRVDYARRRAGSVRVVFAMPARPQGIPDDDIVVLPFGEGVAWRDVVTFARLTALLVRRRRMIDVAHFYSTKLVLLGPVLSAVAGVPSIVTVTGFGRAFTEHGLRYRVARIAYHVAFRVATRLARLVLFQNRGDLEATTERLPRIAGKVRYVGSATAEVAHLERPPPGDVLHVLHVARLLPSKGIDDLLALARAMRDDPVDFALAGGPSAGFPDLLAEVRAAAADGVLRYLGRIDKDDLEEAYLRSDILFFPSYGEGMARVMLEAGMRGVCPVAYDIAANRDLVQPGGGFLVPVGDVPAARDVLMELARDRALLADNAARYRAHVRRHFGTEAFSDRIDEVVAEVTGAAVPA